MSLLYREQLEVNRVYAGHEHSVGSLPRGLFECLQQLLEGRDDAFAMIEIVSPKGAHRQIDCAIFSPGGIDVIEIKDKKNPVIGGATTAWATDDGGPSLNQFSNTKKGRPENPYTQANNTAQDVLDWLSKRSGGRRRKPKAYPLVLIPFAAPGCKIERHNWVHLALGLDQLSRELRAINNSHRFWEPEDYMGVPAELGLLPIDLAEVKGHTVDRTTGKALQRVVVEATGLARPVQVDTRGNFSLTVKPGRSLTLRFRPATTHEPHEEQVHIRQDQRLIELGDIYFEPLQSKESTARTEKEVLELQAQIEALSAQHAKEIQQILDQAQRDRTTAEAQVAEIQRRHRQEVEEFKRMHAQQTADLGHVRELEERVAAADAHLAALNANQPEHQARISELQAEREEYLARMEALQSAAQRQAQQIEEAERRAAATLKELGLLQEQLPHYLQKIAALEEDRSVQCKELEVLRAEHARVQGALASAAQRSDYDALAHELEQARTRLEQWTQRSQTEKREQETLFRQREARLQEQLDSALARLSALNTAAPGRAGSVLTRSLTWQSRVQADGAQSPMVRSALAKLQEGRSAPGTSLPERPLPEADPEVWNLPAETLLAHMRELVDRWKKDLPLLQVADQPLRRSMLKRVRDALDELEEGVEDGDPAKALEEARRVMLSLVPEGPSSPASSRPAERPTVHMTSGVQPLTDAARPWVVFGGVLQDLGTGETASLIIPGVEKDVLPRELDGLVGLREGAGFVPIWALPKERQMDAWLPDSWAAALTEGNPEELVERAPELTPVQFRTLCRSLPLETLLTWTGHAWPTTHLGALHDAVLAQFTDHLQRKGITPTPVPVNSEQVQRPLQLGDLETVQAPENAEARDGVSVPLPGLDLNPLVVQGLPSRVRDSGLYLHQALSLHLIQGARTGGYDVVLSTPTASGKTMAFLPGVLEGVMAQGSHALFLYPLRALSADQLRTLREVQSNMGESAPRLARHFGTEEVDPNEGIPQLLVATPDKLNSALVTPWFIDFLSKLHYVVLDEAHTYRGPFGANMSGFLRRMLALCPSPPTLILSSATLQNTVAFARNLTGRPAFRVAGASTAPRFPRHLYVAASRTGQPHRSHIGALRGIGEVVRQRERKGLIFAGSRGATREIARELHRETDHPAAPTSFAFYSGMKNYDLELERLRDKEARPLIAASTNTLEAGVDIGDIDMVTVVGFPRSRNSFKQMAGRAGRIGTAHISFLPGDSPADVYYSRPDTLRNLLARESEPVYLNAHNPILALPHVERARYEAECAGNDTGPALLDALFPEGLHHDDRDTLLEVFDHAVRFVRAPHLRGNVTEPHVVVRIGGKGGRHPTEVNLTWTEEESWLFERLGAEAAYREWPRDGRISRGNDFFRVVSWRRGTLREGTAGYPQPVVIIGVQDITEETLPPSEVLKVRVKAAEERVLPPGTFAPRTQTATTRLQVQPAHLDENVTFGPLDVQCGSGEVSFNVSGFEQFEQVTRALCETTDKSPHSKRLKRGEDVAVEVLDAGEVRQPARLVSSTDAWKKRLPWREARRPEDPLWTAYTYPKAWTKVAASKLMDATGRVGGRFKLELPAHTTKQEVRVLQVELHEHTLHEPGPCTCGQSTGLRTFWQEGWTPVQEQLPPLPEDPRRWEAHDPAQHTFTTDMARLTLTGGDSASHRAVMLALVKALPDLLEVDPQEFGVGVTSCPEFGDLELVIWDATPGGTGVTRALEETLPALNDATRSLLTRALSCSCEGAGCFGCILPLERVHSLMSAPADDPEEALRLDQLVFSRFAADLDIRAAIALCTEGA